jgi:hypothetical protein
MNASTAPPPGLVAQRVIAVPWRHAGLIALFALAGALASAAFRPHPAPTRGDVVKPHMQAIQDAPSGAIDLRLDPEPGAAVLAVAAARIAVAARVPPATLRLDDVAVDDAIAAALREAPPAAGRMLRPPSAADEPARASLPGLAAGLLMGLLVASLRELGGQRMRSPREAQWALGAPVLGAIPTLSAKARDALVEPSRAA